MNWDLPLVYRSSPINQQVEAFVLCGRKAVCVTEEKVNPVERFPDLQVSLHFCAGCLAQQRLG